MRRFCLTLLASAVLGACGGGGTGPTPNSIAMSGGNNQVDPAGTALPESLAVIVRDQGGAPRGGVTVTFMVIDGGGAVSPGSQATGADGIAKTRWTLGSIAGAQTVLATAGSLTPVLFSAVSQINGAVNIATSTIGPLTDTVDAIEAESLVVLVTDQNFTPVQGVVVTWASTGGSVSPVSAPTNAAGLSKTRFTYGTVAGNQLATATPTGLVGSPILVPLSATAGTAVGIAKAGGDNRTASPSTQVYYTVQSSDTHGNAKGGVTIDWAVATGGGSIAPAQNTTAAVNGYASAARTLGSGLGDQTATATAAGLPSSPSVTFTSTAAAVVTTVRVADNSFTPSTISVPRNTTITWEWKGSLTHNVTFSGGAAPANIPDRTSGSVTRTFNNPGTFTYQCTNHPGMNGSVSVTL